MEAKKGGSSNLNSSSSSAEQGWTPFPHYCGSMLIKVSVHMKFPIDALVNNNAVGELCLFYLVVGYSNTHLNILTCLI